MPYRLSLVATSAFLVLSAGTAAGADAPAYRGKAVLIVDETLNADLGISNKLVRLTEDLIGDGWRVLRHDVERGKDPTTQNADWQLQVRKVRATIKADYDASPTEVKSVMLLGHVAVPYAGNNYVIVGGHSEWYGAHAADPFYGELTTPYAAVGSVGGWSDSLDYTSPFQNVAGDGRFDLNFLPSALEAAVGRIDFYNMPAFTLGGETLLQTELRLISQYLEKDHDFRVGNFLVQRRAILAGKEDYLSGATGCSEIHNYDVVFGVTNVTKFCDCACVHWFSNVDGSGEDHLVGLTLGPSGIQHSEGIGAVHPNDFPDHCTVDSNGVNPSDPSDDNAWLTRNSRVVFLNLYGSYFGEYDYQNNFMRAALANQYDPANGRHGYGLTAVWGGLGIDVPTLSEMALGSPVGEAIYHGLSGVLETSLNNGMLGDPTLRWHVVRPPVGIGTTKTATTVTLTWTHSPDGSG